MRALLLWITGRLPCRLITGDTRQPYLERYYVLGWPGLRVYLHRFVDDDSDRGRHDHPWSWALSIILAGYYHEQRRDGMHIRRWVNWITGDTFHRVTLPREGDIKRDVWTLFVHGPRVKAWGFARPLPTTPGAFDWQPYRYAGDDLCEEQQWWINAPTGREARALRRPA